MSIENQKVKNIIEAALFAADKPMSIDQLHALFGLDEPAERAQIKELIKEIQDEYEQRGIELKQISSGYRFQVRQEYSAWISRLWEEKPPRYTRALLETLALVAYRQPITRGEIEDVRGVAVSSNIMKTLQEREWVKIVGHRDVPGRPALFATTKTFLDYFNLKSMDELPTLAEIKDLDKITEKLNFDAEPVSESTETVETEIVEVGAAENTTDIEMVDIVNIETTSILGKDAESKVTEHIDTNTSIDAEVVDAEESVETLKKSVSSDYTSLPEGTLLN